MALVEGTNCGFVATAPTADPGGTNFAVDTTAQGCKFTSPVGSLRIVELGFYVDNATEEANYDLNIYTHNAGTDAPNTRLSSTGLNNAKGTTSGWKTATGLSINISESTVYWLCVQVDDTATATNGNYTTNASYKRDYKNTQTALPGTWGTSDGTAGEIMAIYAVVTRCSYNQTSSDITYVYQATSGGTSFSANLSGTAAFDYFPDAPAVNDALYFGGALNPRTAEGGYFSDLDFNVGTAMAGTDIVLKWEYYNGSAWADMAETSDGTTAFTTTGANSFKFPWQYYWYDVAVNSVTAMWVRCRLHSFTTVTEGGANQTTAIKKKTGVLDINGSTDAVPASFSDLMTYMNTNYSYITSCVKQNDDTFRFPNVGVSISSRLVSLNENIFYKGGQRFRTDSTAYTLYYLTAGELTATNVGKKGSKIQFWDNSSWYCGTTYTNTKLYGSTLCSKTSGSGVSLGYLDTSGLTAYDTMIYSVGGVAGLFNYARTWVRVTLNCVGAVIQSGGFATQTWTNVTLSANSNHLVYLYLQAGTMDSCWFKPATGYAVFYFYQTTRTAGMNYYLRNPVAAFPSQSDAAWGIQRQETATAAGSSWSKVYFYDDSATSYTDITTAMTNATADDVDLYGAVSDIFYFCFPSGASLYGPAISVTATNASNDYTYIWEQYTAGGWISYTQIWDNTLNFTKNELIYFNTGTAYASTTINGTTGYWMRLRITATGATTPKVSRMMYRDSAGTNNWQVYIQYSVIVKVTDIRGTAISGALVKFTDVLGTTTSLTTDASGLTTSTYFTVDRKYFDPTAVPFDGTNYGRNIATTTYNPYTLTITKTGYYNKKTVITLDKPEWTEVIALENRRDA